jgi:hypothetical protein
VYQLHTALNGSNGALCLQDTQEREAEHDAESVQGALTQLSVEMKWIEHKHSLQVNFLHPTSQPPAACQGDAPEQNVNTLGKGGRQHGDNPLSAKLVWREDAQHLCVFLSLEPTGFGTAAHPEDGEVRRDSDHATSTAHGLFC